MTWNPTGEPPQVIRRRDALLRGLVDEEIARLLRRGEWTALQRGAYLSGPTPAEPRVRHLLAVRATLAGLRTPAVVSHGSAAAVHGLPLWGIPLGQVQVTRQPPGRSDSDTRLRSSAARLGRDDVVAIGAISVTSVARTVVDLARTVPFAPALAVADAALRAGTTADELSAALEAAGGVPGVRAARRVVRAADGRSESVGESRSRALMYQLALPIPDLQVEVRRNDGPLVGRCDFGWRHVRLLGEFDGRVKYGRLVQSGQQPGDVVFAEKRREDALRDEGYGVVRWVWADLDTPALFGRRLASRLGRAA